MTVEAVMLFLCNPGFAEKTVTRRKPVSKTGEVLGVVPNQMTCSITCMDPRLFL